MFNSIMKINDWDYWRDPLVDRYIEKMLKPHNFLHEDRVSYKFDDKEVKYIIEVEIPGFAKEHVSVSLHDKTLKIKAERDNKKYSTSFTLPYRLDRDKISAKVADGLLTIDAPLYIMKEKTDFVKVNVD